MGRVGFIGRVLSFVRAGRNGLTVSDAEVNKGGGELITAEHYAPAGDDSFPLNTDYVLGISVRQTGRGAVIGYLDPRNAPKAEAGEKRTYARDPASGDVVVEFWQKADGSAILVNENGQIELDPEGAIDSRNENGYATLRADGTYEVNNVTIDPDGNIQTPVTIDAAQSVRSPSMVVSGRELAGHDHPITSGSSSGTTGPNNA